MVSSQSTYTVQNVYDDLVAHGDLDPGWNMSGYSVLPIIQICNNVFEEICGGKGMFPWKWNQFNLPQFVVNSWQQDYALVYGSGGASVTNLAWLQEGMAIDINNEAMPKPYSYVEVGRSQQRSTGTYVANTVFRQPVFTANFLPNNVLYYGTWGAAQAGNSSWGNNPQAAQAIANPLSSGGSMPSNPITQIQDSNGNYLVLTGYGTTGNSAPSAAADSAPGTTVTDGTCTWTVVDPYGVGIRIVPVPSQSGTVWQVNLVGQMKPTKFSASAALSAQTLFPLTDDLYPHFLDGAIAQAYRYNPNPRVRANFAQANQQWMQSILDMRREEDREQDEYRIVPERSVIGAGGNASGYLGPYWPHNYPVS